MSHWHPALADRLIAAHTFGFIRVISMSRLEHPPLLALSYFSAKSGSCQRSLFSCCQHTNSFISSFCMRLMNFSNSGRVMARQQLFCIWSCRSYTNNVSGASSHAQMAHDADDEIDAITAHMPSIKPFWNTSSNCSRVMGGMASNHSENG